MNTKKIRKVWFVDDNSPERLEGWLSSMAKKGWKLDEVKRYHYRFRRIDPEEIEYRLLYFHNDEMEGQKERYKEAGWERQ